MFEQSAAAHEEARRLDINVPTSPNQTLLMAGEIDRLLAVPPPAIVAGADDGIRVIGLGLAGRKEEARQRLHVMRQRSHIPAFRSWVPYLSAWLDGRLADMASEMAAFRVLKVQDDPEAIFQEGWLLCDLGEHAQGLALLERGVAKGYYAASTLATRPQFDPLRNNPRFITLQADATAGRQRALAAFRDAGGERLLGA